MAVQEIEQYRMKNGKDILKVILKPTKAFPNGGYFYAPAEAIDLVQEKSWCLAESGNRVIVIASTSNSLGKFTYHFHQELCKFYHGVGADYIDHINMVEVDNIDENLNVVTNQQNGLNRFTKGYAVFNYNHSKLAFRPIIVLNGRNIYPFSCIHREDEACLKQCYAEQVILKEMMGDNFYQFNFYKYRRGELDLLDFERTGQISEEESTYKHILEIADNAWYYYRYNLRDYFLQYHIPAPKYRLDEQGFMIHPVTGEKLCPFN